MELSLILATDLCPNLRQVTEPLCFCGPLFHKVKVRSDITRQRLTQCIRTYLKLMWEAAAKTVTLVDVLFLTSKMKLLPVCLASPGTQMCTQTQGSWASPGVAAPSLQAAPRIRTLHSRTPPAPSFTIHCALTSALLWHILQATAKTQASWPEMPRSGSKSGVNSGLQPSTATPHTHEVRFKTLRHLHPPKSRRGSVHPEWQ